MNMKRRENNGIEWNGGVYRMLCGWLVHQQQQQKKK
jgi:hypothetical protein